MPPEWIEAARVWLAKAESDLATARLLIEGNQKHLDTGSYHCQQAGEKAVKAWLTVQGTIFPKTHNINTLLDLCLPSDPYFDHFRKHADKLTPLATQFRYPGDEFEPSLSEAVEALNLATELLDYATLALDRIPTS
ncbi:MAG TPA: HEPN domain-containing protein [Chthoniobacterales bacterium]